MMSLERYAGRASSLSEYPDVTTLSAYEFIRAFKTINGKLQREPSPADIIVIKLPVIGATKGSRHYPLRCRNNLVAHQPWSGRVEDAWRDKDRDDDDTHHDYGEVDDTYLRWVTLWESYLRVHSHLVPDVDRGERLQDHLSGIRRELLPDEDDPGNFHRDRGDDWMDAAAMAGVVGARDDDVDETWDIDHDCAAARTRFSPEDLASGSTFINVEGQQAGGGPPDNRRVPVVLPSQLNQCQRFAYEIVRAHKDGLGEREPLRMMVLGTAGTGKSWLVNALPYLLGGRTRRAAPTSMAAFLTGGSTLPSLLKLPLRAGRALTGDSLKRLQQSLSVVDYLVIDELSMVSQSQFAWVGRRLRQVTGRTDEVFGGICVIMTGDPGQLPPVCGRALHTGHPKDQLSQEGFSAYKSFRHVIILHKVQRQLAAEDGDRAQKFFLELLLRARDGCLSEDDWRLLLTRAPHLQTEEEMDTFKNATRLFYSKAEVKRYNGTKLRELRTPVLKMEASHSSASARKGCAELV